MNSQTLKVLRFSLALCCLCTVPSGLRANSVDELPANAKGIDIEDKVGEFIPLELRFVDEDGHVVGLRKFFQQDRPIVLTLNYSDCPGLCIAQLENLTNTLREMNGEGLGERYEMISVSIDPSESPSKAAMTKAKYTGMLRGTRAAKSWHFLTGKQQDIAALADALGFRYTYDKANKRFNHAAATYFISSEGRICRYLLSLGVEPDQFKLAVAEAGKGKLTSSISDAFIQFCYLYDPNVNRYTADAKRLMAFGGAAFVMLTLGFTAPFWFSRRAIPAAKAPSPAIAPEQSEPIPYNDVSTNNSYVEFSDSKE